MVDGAWWVENDRAAIFIEANQGPSAIRNSVMAFNGAGVTSTNSGRITSGNAGNPAHTSEASEVRPVQIASIVKVDVRASHSTGWQQSRGNGTSGGSGRENR